MSGFYAPCTSSKHKIQDRFKFKMVTALSIVVAFSYSFFPAINRHYFHRKPFMGGNNVLERVMFCLSILMNVALVIAWIQLCAVTAFNAFQSSLHFLRFVTNIISLHVSRRAAFAQFKPAGRVVTSMHGVCQPRSRAHRLLIAMRLHFDGIPTCR